MPVYLAALALVIGRVRNRPGCRLRRRKAPARPGPVPAGRQTGAGSARRPGPLCECSTRPPLLLAESQASRTAAQVAQVHAPAGAGGIAADRHGAGSSVILPVAQAAQVHAVEHLHGFDHRPRRRPCWPFPRRCASPAAPGRCPPSAPAGSGSGRLPSVLPPGRSARLANSCTGTPARRQTSRSTAPGKPARRVLLARVDLQHNAAAHAHGVGRRRPCQQNWGAWRGRCRRSTQSCWPARRCMPWALWGHRVINAPEHIAQKQAVRALARAAADLLVVQHRPNRRAGGVGLGARPPGRHTALWPRTSRSSMRGAMKYSPAGPITAGACRTYSVRSQSTMSASATPSASASRAGSGRQPSGPYSGCMSTWGVIAVAVVDAAVHVRRQRGDHGQVTVQVDQPRRQRAVRPAHQHPPGHRKRPVQPGWPCSCRRVAFHIELGAPGGGHGCVLDAPGRRIAVAGRDAPAADGVRRDAPGDDGAVVARDIVAAPGLQVPVCGFLQAGVARGVQQAGGFGRRVERRDARPAENETDLPAAWCCPLVSVKRRLFRVPLLYRIRALASTEIW